MLLGGGAALFGCNAFFTVPIETWFAMAGFLLFVAGLLLSLFAFFRATAVLTNTEMRRSNGLTIPIVTTLIAAIAWSVVINTAIQAKRSMDKRAQYEEEHWDELHGTNESQQSGPAYPPQGVGSADP